MFAVGEGPDYEVIVRNRGLASLGEFLQDVFDVYYDDFFVDQDPEELPDYPSPGDRSGSYKVQVPSEYDEGIEPLGIS